MIFKSKTTEEEKNNQEEKTLKRGPATVKLFFFPNNPCRLFLETMNLYQVI